MEGGGEVLFVVLCKSREAAVSGCDDVRDGGLLISLSAKQ